MILKIYVVILLHLALRSGIVSNFKFLKEKCPILKNFGKLAEKNYI